MPDLPGKKLSQAHFDRVVAAFPGNTAAQKAEAYDVWLTNRLVERVQMVEARRIRAEMDVATTAALELVTNSLPPLQPEPDFSPAFNPNPNPNPGVGPTPRSGTLGQ